METGATTILQGKLSGSDEITLEKRNGYSS